MKLESARALKQQLKHEIATPALSALSVTAATAAAALPLFAGAVATATLATPRLLARFSIGIGVSGRDGNYRIAIRVYMATPGVERLIEQIRHTCKGEIDERVVGPVRKQVAWHRKGNRPLLIGGSIGRTDENAAGTLGAFAASRSGSGNELVLSNNHVLAKENAGHAGDRIVQQGRLDGGNARTGVVAELSRFKKLKKRNNLVDAAVAELKEDTEYYYNHLKDLGTLKGLRSAPLRTGDKVFKLGRTTGLTEGRIIGVEMDSVFVGGYDQGVLEFDEQVEIEPIGNKPFSLAGDSGSLIVDGRNKAVGLLFAGNDADVTYANEISNVLDTLKIDLVY